METLKNIGNILFIVGLIVTAICAGLAGIFQHKASLKEKACLATTTGTVVEISKTINVGRGFGYRKYYATFDVNGKEYVATGVNMYATDVGDRVTVHYQHFDPGSCYIGEKPAESSYRTHALSFGGAFAMVGVMAKFRLGQRRPWSRY